MELWPKMINNWYQWGSRLAMLIKTQPYGYAKPLIDVYFGSNGVNS